MADALWTRHKELLTLMVIEKHVMTNEQHLAMKQECAEIIVKISNMVADYPMKLSHAFEFSQHLIGTYCTTASAKNEEVSFEITILSRMLKKMKEMSDKASTTTKKRTHAPRTGPPYKRPRGAAPKNKRWDTLTGSWVLIE